MGLFTLFELFLVIFSLYAILKYEGGMRILVPVMCLVAVFLFERLQASYRKKSVQTISRDDM